VKIKTDQFNVRKHTGHVWNFFIPGLAFLTLMFLNHSCGKHNSPKFTQYYNQGEKLYLKHCSNCHQRDGSGLGRVYPPLNESDFMDNNFEHTLCLIRYGTSGELMVNGVQFNHPMPGIPQLSDLEIAEVATYIYNTWEHEHGMVEVKDASEILDACLPPN
jgi:cytochrome c551